MTAGRVFFYVQHLLGVGHLQRAARLCRGLTDSGLEVDVISGGVPVPWLELGAAKLFQLPAVKVGPDGWYDLRDDGDRPVDEDWKQDRCDRLLGLFAERRPDVLLIEAFPFGRRQMRFELLPLLAAAGAASPRPVVACSVRDILKTDRKPGRAEETVALVAAEFDHVLVHGDPNFARLEETFPAAAAIAGKLRYTGIVADRGARDDAGPRPAGEQEVMVSAGGGAVGEKLLKAALGARAMTRFGDVPWRLLCGPNLGEAAFIALTERAPDGVAVERYRSDFPHLLTRAAVSVSQAGYNTVADILVAGVPAVLVPYAVGGETEQSLRATRLAERGLVQALDEKDLAPESLARAIEAALDAPALAADINLDGAANSAALIEGWLAGNRRVISAQSA